ncbi:hypothetical protein ACFLTI_07885 [Bacteroidota bacterium]
MEKEKNMKIDVSNINLNNSFRVPDDYFDDLPGLIQRKINKAELKSPKRNIFLYPWSKVAAAVIVVLLIVTAIDKTNIFTDRFSENEVAEIIDNYSYDIDESLIMAYIEEKTDLFLEETETDYEMINYLIDEGIEIEDLIEELK